MTTAFQSNAFQTHTLAFQIEVTTTTVDTHDGFEDNFRKRLKDEARLHAQVMWAAEHPGIPIPPQLIADTALDLTDPDVQTMLREYVLKKQRELMIVLSLL